MRHKLSRFSMILDAGGTLATGAAAGARGATTASVANTAKDAVAAPIRRTVLSVPNGTANNQIGTVATSRTIGWGFLNNATAASACTGAFTWKKFSLPGPIGAVNVAGPSSPFNVRAAYPSGNGTKLYPWNGTIWGAAKPFAQGTVDATADCGGLSNSQTPGQARR